jgi:predicted enzyme related to lactoylglutathione lyase
MSDPKPPIGSIGWCDLTVPHADTIRDFYKSVVGFGSQDVDMGGYFDYVMTQPGSDAPTSGICWARGGNAGLPPVWLVYFIVPRLDDALARVRKNGGSVLREPTSGGGGRFAVVKDPAGAVCALYQSGD